MGMLEPYTPKGADQIKPAFKSSKSPMSWTGMDAWLAVICYNTIEGGKKSMPKPAAWMDLANPVYKDSIVMPNPASSGTGYQAVYAWIQIMGEKAAWDFMDKLHQNVAVYTHSGSAPAFRLRKASGSSALALTCGAQEKKPVARPLIWFWPRKARPGTWRPPRLSRAPKPGRRTQAGRLGGNQEGL